MEIHLTPNVHASADLELKDQAEQENVVALTVISRKKRQLSLQLQKKLPIQLILKLNPLSPRPLNLLKPQMLALPESLS